MVSMGRGIISLPRDNVKKRTTGLFHFVALAFLLAGCEQPNQGDTTVSSADVIFLHGGVYTVEAEQLWAEAVAVRGDAIIYVGPDS